MSHATPPLASEPTVDASGSGIEALMQFLYRAPIGLIQARRDGAITMLNPMAVQLLMPLGRQGSTDSLFVALEPMVPGLREACDAARPGDMVYSSQRLVWPTRPDSRPLEVMLSLVCLDAETLMVSLANVTHLMQQEQQRSEDRVRHAERVDPLTALPNRAALLEHLHATLARLAAEGGRSLAVLHVDIDRFSRLRLSGGQAQADDLVLCLAQRLQSAVRGRAPLSQRPGTTVARIGTDEFVLVLEGLPRPRDVHRAAERLLAVMNQPYSLEGKRVYATVSLGAVTCTTTDLAATASAPDAESLLMDASLAMREAKAAGGACCRVFVPTMKEAAQHRASLETELRLALQDDQLFVVYQPIVRLDDGGAAGLEALVRWRHPQRGVVSPLEFIPIAEETGLIVTLGRCVLRKACQQFVAWQRSLAHRAPQVLSVNLSRMQLAHPHVVGHVRGALTESGLAPGCLQLEVTESVAAEDPAIQARLHELKALGVTLALDDFGTGYSSLSSLHQWPIDVVKIDRSFVSRAEASAHHRALIEATVRVAQSLGMRTVAEGVETQAQADVLQRLACDKAQGYLFGRPMPAEGITAWLQGQRMYT